MKEATLAIILNKDRTQVLLGMKKRGEIGTGTWNGPGGKKEEYDTDLVACVIRETEEEFGITLSRNFLDLVAVITFYSARTPDFRVYVYRTTHFEGDVRETKDMVPQWFPVDALPLHAMLESDRMWFLRAITTSSYLEAQVYYRERAKGFERIEFQTP